MSETVATRGREAVAQRMASAAAEWLASLDAGQRALAVADGPGAGSPSEDDRLTWFFTPTDHGGVTLHEQSPQQQSLAMQLVSSGLSMEGYVTACVIMGTENILDRLESWRIDWGMERGRDPQRYYLRVFGTPGSGTWAWRFGGHHISMNNLVVDGRLVSATPSFFGSDPAEAGFVGGGHVRPLGAGEDHARALLHALGPGQRDLATLLDRAPADIVGGNRTLIGDDARMPRMDDVWRGRFREPRLADYISSIHDREEERSGFDDAAYAVLSLTRDPKGIPGSALSPGQRALLLQTITAYTGRAPDEIAAEESAFYSVGANLDAVHFAWAGSADRGRPHYYRIQGPRILIEYDNTQREGNHCHAAWRDPVADFGLDVLHEHLDVFHRDDEVIRWPAAEVGGRA
ncbi:DUF3500 domain-containing protein [Agromyces sp. SYSU T0242]|uniref:DUF3500 domain-containing protein n=1 Tax=Agromyces litoreus TaxID=3158561 RepID=UPI0033919727